MLKIKRLVARDFLSLGLIDVQFPESGVFFLKGENRDNGDGSGIESGKSNLLEAVYYCIFGKTMRNLTKADYPRWGCSDFYLMVEFYDGTVIERTLNTVTFNGETSDKKTSVQSKINTYLGMDFKPFFYATFCGFPYKSFVELYPTERLKTFTSLFGLDVFDDAIKVTKKKVEKFTAQENKLNTVIAELNGRIFQLSAGYDKEIIEWEDKRRKKIAKLESDIKRLKEKIEFAHQKLVEKQSKLEEVSYDKAEKLDEIKAKIDSHQMSLRELQNKKIELASQINIIKRDIKAIDKQIELVNSGMCPTCKRPFDDPSNLLVELRNAKKELHDKLNELSNKSIEVDTRIEKLQELISKLNAQYRSIIEREKLAIALSAEIDKVKEYINMWTDKVNELASELNKLRTEKNPFEELEKERVSKISKLQHQLNSNVKKRQQLQEKIKCYTFWITGFRKAKLIMFTELKRVYEQQFNNYLRLFGSNASVTIPDSEDKFEFVFRYGNVEKVMFDSFSSGGKMILRLASSFALSDILQYYTDSRKIGFMFLDEPLVNLSKKERMLFLDFLYSQKNKKQIFLIEHALDVGDMNFDRVFLVIKEAGVSSVEVLK